MQQATEFHYAEAEFLVCGIWHFTHELHKSKRMTLNKTNRFPSAIYIEVFGIECPVVNRHVRHINITIETEVMLCN